MLTSEVRRGQREREAERLGTMGFRLYLLDRRHLPGAGHGSVQVSRPGNAARATDRRGRDSRLPPRSRARRDPRVAGRPPISRSSKSTGAARATEPGHPWPASSGRPVVVPHQKGLAARHIGEGKVRRVARVRVGNDVARGREGLSES